MHWAGVGHALLRLNAIGRCLLLCFKFRLAIYRQNFFPEVKVAWRTYPDFVGHDLIHIDAPYEEVSCVDCNTSGPQK
jgi:hypothetical protein